MATKPTKFDPVKYAARKTALQSIRTTNPATINSVPALRDRVVLLEKVVGI